MMTGFSRFWGTSPWNVVFLLLLLSVHSYAGSVATSEVEEDQHKDFYIVYTGEGPADKETAVQKHIDLLSTSLDKSSEKEARESLVYSYCRSFNAFAAKLTHEEAEAMSGMENVISVIPNRYHKLDTTRSWDFLGFSQAEKRSLKTERNIIVGLLDTGITPESESFKDDGFGPPPAKWKGSCGHFANFSGCNNKLIGARYFKLDRNPDPADILSPVDVRGHGTHTSSTAAGNSIPNASLYGLGQGEARGAVPSARIAMYKVCWASSGCADMDILAAFEAAIADGVDIISISIGGVTQDYVTDTISIGSFHAMRKGILTVASAGNDGPSLGTVGNHAPWMLTVGASGTDRQFRSGVALGNGKNMSGIGISMFDKKTYPIIMGEDAARSPDTKSDARFCGDESLSPTKVKGKVVICDLQNIGAEAVVKEAGGAGAIVVSEQFRDVAFLFMAPGTMVSDGNGDYINSYINSSKRSSTPSATIHRTEEVKIRGAPSVASFSSRGPNPGSIRILKPDIVAPGIDILAAYTPLRSLTGRKGDTQFSKFSIMTGTSMACPHVAGVAAYVKSFHPDWSPAAIQSAIITSAKRMIRGDREAEFGYGAGQVNPHKARSPGLVYDMDQISYIQFLCKEGYKGSSLSVLVGSKSINCSALVPSTFGHDSLNYPTIQLYLQRKTTTTVVFRRTVTNVGPDLSVYNVTIRAPSGLNVTVKPATLSFSSALQKRNFKVVVNAQPMKTGTILSASLIWRSSRHFVRTPIVIYQS